MLNIRPAAVVGVLFSLLLFTPPKSQADESHALSLSDGHITMTAPEAWERIPPANNIIDVEFSIAPVEEDENRCRLTIMGAGGEIEANTNRWIGQFSQPDEKTTRERTTIEVKEINGQTVHLVDITGTFRDQRGPIAPATTYESYRMLAAIIPTEERGQYFVKLVGPRRTIAENEDSFLALLESLKVD